MLEKKREQASVYHGSHIPAAAAKEIAHDTFQFEDYAVLKQFCGRHPSVMRDRVGSASRWGTSEIDGLIGGFIRKSPGVRFAGRCTRKVMR